MALDPRQKAIKTEHFANLVAIAYADNFLDEDEKSFLTERAQEIGLNMDEVHTMLENAESLKCIVPLNEEEIQEQISDIVYMAMVDGHLHEKEYEMCLDIAKKLDYSKTDLDHVIELTRKLWANKVLEQRKAK